MEQVGGDKPFSKRCPLFGACFSYRTAGGGSECVPMCADEAMV